MDIQALIASWFYGKGKSRHDQGPWPQQVISPYDIPDALIQDMIARGVRPWSVETLNLATAGSKVIMTPGFHVVLYGHDNSANKAINTTAIVNCWWGDKKQAGVNPFPLKHARGLSGPFQALYIEWVAQSNVYADLVVHTGMNEPWIDGESCT
mgnify:CR=1 FL=1